MVYVAKVEALNLATGLQEDLYFSSSTFNTNAADTPANQSMLAGFTSPNLEGNIFNGRAFSRLTTGKGGRRSIGQIKIANPKLDATKDPHGRTGTWDALVAGDQVTGLLTGPYDLLTRNVTGYIGPEDGGFLADFEAYFTAVIESIDYLSDGIGWRVNPAGQDWRLPVQDNFYGAGYTVTEIIFPDPPTSVTDIVPMPSSTVYDDLFGVPRPVCLGEVLVRPQVISFGSSIYQYHSEDSQVTNDVVEVYEGSYSSTDGGPVYSEDVSENTITLNATPDKPITAHIQGAKPGGTYINKPGDLINEILTQHMGYVAGDFVASTVTDYNTEFNYVCGIYIDGELQKSREDAIAELLAPLGFLVFTRAGKIKLGWVGEPYDPVTPPTLAFDEGDIQDLSFTWIPPAWRVLVGYKPMDRPLSESDILGAASSSDKQLHSRKYRWVEAVDHGVKRTFKDAVELKFETRFWTKANAQTLADECLAIFRQWRRYCDLKLTNKMFQYDLGDLASIGWPRYGFIADGNWEFEDGTTIDFEDAETVEKENPAAGLPGLVVGFVDNPGSGEFRVRCWA